MIQSRTDNSVMEIKPDLTALLDIIFIVMVFLLLTANISIKTMTLDIPTTDQMELLDSPETAVIAVSLLASEPSWAIEETLYQDWQLFSKALLELKNKYPKRSLLIAADKTVSVDKMLRLLAFMQKNQINATNIVMDEEQ